MKLVIVESPAKAKTINKYLGKDYKVLASYGHVRDLPSKDGSVDPNADFAMVWNVDAKAQKRVKEIADAAKASDGVILATDPDREGEAISWHVLELLKKKKALNGIPVERVTFNAITKTAIHEAMAKPRAIDDELVQAYLARRALDYLVGFTLSPVLWRKLPGSRSAGRVQSVSLRLVCERELEIEKFKTQEYWSIEADMAAPDGTGFPARLVTLDGKALKKHDLENESQAMAARDAVAAGTFSVASVDRKPTRRNPPPPFTTSTLQQEAARKLGFNAQRTMRTAQNLYEGVEIGGDTVGLITYMRTDGVQIAGEAIAAARNVIEGVFGARYVPEKPRGYKSKQKNAQEAHEAIRPTDLGRLPEAVRGKLDKDQAALYDLIWKRTLASQMETAIIERTTVELAEPNGRAGLRATGSVIAFDGFLKLYQEGKDDEEDENGNRLPALNDKDATKLVEVRPRQHFTEPPPRYTEASLVKKMEELGIGRPSTYASTLSVLRDRAYVRMDRNRFFPEDKGRLVIAFLESFFTRYVEYDFTAGLENQLDEVAAGKLGWQAFLRAFWDDFQINVDAVADLRVSQVLDALNDLLGPHIFPQTEEGKDPRACPDCDDGQLSLKVGKYGAFIGCSNYPDCRHTRQISQSEVDANGGASDKELGIDERTGRTIWFKTGRFGPYLELLPKEEGEKKPPRASLPKDIDPANLDLSLASTLLALPREVGTHPETGKPILAGIGRYGPYVLHDGKYGKLESTQAALEIGLNRAVTVIAEAKPGRGASKTVLKDLGEHPDEGGKITVLDGRYGPYVNHGKVNATIPKGRDPEGVTLEEALEWVAAKAAKKKPAKKKAPAKKKPAAKKKAAPKKKAS